MSNEHGDQETHLMIAEQLPYLRRYARALTGNQETGDRYAAATLEAILEDRTVLSVDAGPRVGLFRAFHSIWSSAGAPVSSADTSAAAKAQARLSKLTKNSREALLLSTIEAFTEGEIGSIMKVDEAEARLLLSKAHDEMKSDMIGKVMVIEDEAIIALDLESIVEAMGHSVTGVARTKDSAVELGQKTTPDLILADIQLADNSSGIDAVNELMETLPDVPVVFITAFPERLLTGERPEPTFMISKPYTEEQVRSAISQAMFFSSTETLLANET